MIKTTVKEVKRILGKLVDKDYYILWAFEESRAKGAQFLEFFISTTPIVSIVIEQNIAEYEKILIHGIKIYVNKDHCASINKNWDDIIKELRILFLNKRETEMYRESKDYVYVIIGTKNIKNLISTLENIRKMLENIGFKIPNRIIGYDYTEVV